ncbi:MAG: plasmid stabilization protein [Herbinix sp.]|jgi:plasmid stabilization system protein ParE|nr:plasmid stabilization protein [Herbinix sp.]
MAEINYRLRYLPLFEDDLSEILFYIINKLKNPQAAQTLLYEIEKLILERLSYPESFEPYHSAKYRSYPYYCIYVKNFIIFYVVIDDEKIDTKIMEVRRILYNKRNKNKLI